jgi:hypothetical protein
LTRRGRVYLVGLIVVLLALNRGRDGAGLGADRGLPGDGRILLAAFVIHERRRRA